MTTTSNTSNPLNTFAAATRAALTGLSLLVGLATMTAMSATAETSESVQSDAGQKGSLVIYRGKGLSANSLMYYRVYVDGKMVGQLKRNTAFQLKLSPGEHLIETNDPEESSIMVTVDANSKSYVNASINKHWQVAMESVQPTPTLAARLDNCANGVSRSCRLEESARFKSDRIVSR